MGEIIVNYFYQNSGWKLAVSATVDKSQNCQNKQAVFYTSAAVTHNKPSLGKVDKNNTSQNNNRMKYHAISDISSQNQ